MLTSAEAAKSNATDSSHPCYHGHKTRARPSSACYSLVFGQLGWPSGEKTLYAICCAVSTNNSYIFIQYPVREAHGYEPSTCICIFWHASSIQKLGCCRHLKLALASTFEIPCSRKLSNLENWLVRLAALPTKENWENISEFAKVNDAETTSILDDLVNAAI